MVVVNFLRSRKVKVKVKVISARVLKKLKFTCEISPHTQLENYQHFHNRVLKQKCPPRHIIKLAANYSGLCLIVFEKMAKNRKVRLELSPLS